MYFKVILYNLTDLCVRLFILFIVVILHSSSANHHHQSNHHYHDHHHNYQLSSGLLNEKRNENKIKNFQSKISKSLALLCMFSSKHHQEPVKVKPNNNNDNNNNNNNILKGLN